MAIDFSYKRKDPNEYDSVKTAKSNMDKYGTYTESDSVTNAKNLASQNLALKPGDWDSNLMSKDKLEAWDAWKNRPDFSYDVNGDALYQQYKDQYINQGRLAMMDTMGQAAAMTGGYGNSYASSVGNQAYQGYLQKLNEVVPDLYNMAYNMYQQEGEDLKYAYDVARDDYNTKYGEWADSLGFWQSEQNRLDTNAYNEANIDWSKFDSNRNYHTGLYNTALDWATNNENTQYTNAFAEYQQGKAEEQWNKNYELQADAQRIAELQAGVKRDSKGKIVSVATPTGASDKDLKNIESKLSKMSNNGEMDEYLISLEQQGIISEDERADLYAKYRIQEQKALNERSWTMTNNGGNNLLGFWSSDKYIDDNAKAKDQYGNEYSMRDLYNELEDSMGADAAKKYVLKLQKDLGIV